MRMSEFEAEICLGDCLDLGDEGLKYAWFSCDQPLESSDGRVEGKSAKPPGEREISVKGGPLV